MKSVTRHRIVQTLVYSNVVYERSPPLSDLFGYITYDFESPSIGRNIPRDFRSAV